MRAARAGRPQLTSDELQRLKWLLGGLLSLLGVSTLLYMDIEAWVLMGITVLATGSTMLRPHIPARIPPLIHTLAFPVIVAFFAADLWLRTEILPAMVRLDILLLLYRNLTYRQRRDDLQIIVLGLFLVVVAGVLTVSITFALHILVYTGCSLALLLSITLSEAALGGVRQPPPLFREVPSWAQHVSWRQLFWRLREVVDWRVLGLGVTLFACVVGMSAVLFLAIPRFQLESGMFLDRFISKKAKSGFNDTIRFGDVTEIQQDNAVALSVDVSDQTQIPAAPYWRMLVLDSYADGVFSVSPQLKRAEFGDDSTNAFLRGRARPKPGASVYWTFYLESGVSRFLPLLGHFEALRFREVQNYKMALSIAVLALKEEPVSMTAYQVEGFEISPALPDPEFARRWLAGQGDRARPRSRPATVKTETDQASLRASLHEALGGRELAAPELARTLSEWLKSRHAYSLSPRIPSGAGDPLVRWLVSHEPGHCELFAGSFVLLARTAGFPARVVTGFRGGTWNGYSNNFTIRNADAHAWAEIFDEISGAWIRADPLAMATNAQAEEVRGEAAMASRMDRSWKARMDSLRVFWYRRIVSFDQRSQVETLKAMKEATQNSGRRLRAALLSAITDAKAWLAAPWDTPRIATGLLGVAVLLGVVWFWRAVGRDWWRRVRRRSDEQRGDPVRREAGHWLASLQEWSEQRGPDQELVRALQRLRYGPRGTWPDAVPVFRRARHALREARRRERVTGT